MPPSTSLSHFILIAVAGFVAGGMNALAGGGTFFSFPALLAAGIPPISANASNTVALWPASLASAWIYRHKIQQHRSQALRLILVSLTGSAIGVLLLLNMSNQTFAQLIPWLLLSATVLFTLSKPIACRLQQNKCLKKTLGQGQGSVVSLSFQSFIAIYGGFFGAGMGILTLAALSIQGMHDIQELNALKNLASAVNNTVSAFSFIVVGIISPSHTLIMLGTAILGAYMGTHVARRLPARLLRRFIIIVGSALSLIYFIKTYA